MGSGDIVVGKVFPKSAPVSPETSAGPTGHPISGREERHCGAMSQQQANNDAVSTPQKFLHLIGYRDPRARPTGGR